MKNLCFDNLCLRFFMEYWVLLQECYILEKKEVKRKHFLVKNNFELAKFLKKNIYGKKIVIGMGAGTISNWMRELPELMK